MGIPYLQNICLSMLLPLAGVFLRTFYDIFVIGMVTMAFEIVTLVKI